MLKVQIVKRPEDNGGLLVTASATSRMQWVVGQDEEGNRILQEIGRATSGHVIRRGSDLWIPSEEYWGHVNLAKKCFGLTPSRHSSDSRHSSEQARLPL